MGYFTGEKLNERVTRILCPENVYVYLVEGETSAALIDTGFGVGSLKEYVESLTKLPYIVLLTHGHLDHAGGAGEFAQVYLNERDLSLAGEHTSLEKRVPRLCKAGSGIDAKELIPPKALEEYLPLQDGQSFDLGGMTVTMLALPGHTKGSMCVLFEELRCVLLGDACNSYGYLQMPESSSIAEYRESLIAFRQHTDAFDQVWYSHPHNFGGKEILEETIKLCGEIISGSRKGVPVEMSGMDGDFFVAKEVDGQGHPKDGGVANFIYRSRT